MKVKHKKYQTRNIKISSRGRKPMFKLSLRQRKRIFNLSWQNHQRHNNMLDNPSKTTDSHTNIVSSSHYSFMDQMSYASEQHNELSSVVNEQCNEFSSYDSMNVSNCNLERNILFANDSDSNLNEDLNTFHIFQKSLAESFVKGNLTHTQGNIILNTLRSLPCLSYLPKIHAHY